MGTMGSSPDDVAPTRGAARRAGRLLRTIAVVTVEASCPTLLLAILVDCTRHVEWIAYGRDPAIYASIARFWQDGLVPYRDVWEFKLPLIFVALRTGFALWGYDPESLRRVFLLATWLGALAMYLGLRRARCLIAAPVAALGLMTLVVANVWALPLQNTESLVVAFAACAIGCAAAHQGGPRWWWALLTGASLGLATAGKQPAALFALPLGMQLCLWGAPDGWRGRAGYVAQRALLGMGGFGIVAGAFALYFAHRDALGAAYQAVVVDGGRYASALDWLRPTALEPPLGRRIPPAVRQLLTPTPEWPYVHGGQMWPYLGAVAVLALRTLWRPTRWVATAWAWLLAAALAVLLGPYAENHYLVMALPALALAAGIAGELCWPAAAPLRCGRPTMRLLGGLLIAAILFGPAWRVGYMPRRSQGPGIDLIEQEARRLGEQIRAAAQPGDRLFVGDEPLQIYLYAGVPPASRFIYWNAPNPNAIAERRAAVQREPTFFFIPAVAERQRQALLVERPGAPDPMAERYERWLTSPVGNVYRRRAAE